MRVVFAHDHRFIRRNGAVFSEYDFPESLWTRYLAHFEDLTALVRQGVISEGKTQADLECSSRERVSFEFVPNLSSPKSQCLRRLGALKKARAAISNSDAVIARLPSEIGLMAIQVARELNRPWAVEVAGCPWDGLWNYGFQGKLYAPVMATRVRRAVAKAPFALYVTNEFLQRRYPNRQGLTVSCSNVEIDQPSELVWKGREDRIEGERTPLILGLIGSLKTRHKGLHIAFQALGKARTYLPEVRLHVLGNGDVAPWRREAEANGVDDIVSFDGTVFAGDPVRQWLDGIDLYLQPSFREGLPRALIEAMSRGCPALASSCAGIPELLEPQCLIRPGDADTFAEKIVRALREREWRREQGRRNWITAGNYGRETLEARRSAFWAEFADYALSVKSAPAGAKASSLTR